MGKPKRFTPPKPSIRPVPERRFTPREKLSFFRLRDRAQAGDSNKDRRHGRDVMAEKDWLSAHRVNLGDLVRLEKAHDKYKEGRIRMALRKLFGG